jgi:hypothetical protein
MGFSLHGYLVFRLEAVALFDRMFPGSARFAHRVPVSGDGPEGWLLPRPMGSWITCWPLEDAAHEAQLERFEEAVSPWRSLREALGLPMEGLPRPHGDEMDWLLCALLSLAGGPGAVELFDETFGGVIGDEFASAWKDGRFVAAAASPMKGRAYAIGPREASKEETPVAWCAAHLDPAFTGRFLYDGYFPRGHDGVPAHAPPPLPPVHLQWPEGWPESVRDVLHLTS